MLETQKNARRASKPKSRSGCLTCKSRRIKCDERKPNCTACSKTSWPCKWKLKYITKPVIVPRRPSQNAPALALQPQDSLDFMDSKEAWYFQSYMAEAAPELGGILHAVSPWSYSVLQACRTEPFVLRAVVAISALNKSIKMFRVATVGPLSIRATALQAGGEHREFALSCYAQAIKGMQNITLGIDKTASLRKVLLSCLLIYCMETFLESPQTAYKQCQNGFELLHQWTAGMTKVDAELSSPNSAIVENDLFEEFTRLDVESALYLDTDLKRRIRSRQVGAQAVQNMPLEFKLLGEARRYQVLLMRRTYHLIGEVQARITSAKEKMMHPSSAGTFSSLIDPCFVPADLLPIRDRYISDLYHWRASFANLLQATINIGLKVPTVEARLIQGQTLEAEISLRGAFFTSESSYDTLFPQFHEIFLHALSCLKMCVTVDEDVRPVFNISSGYERPLHALITHCRDKKLRDQACRILPGTSRRDGAKTRARRSTQLAYLAVLEEKSRLNNGKILDNNRYRLIWSRDHENLLHESKLVGGLTAVYARRTGFPLGEMYPADVEYRVKTFTKEEAENMITGEVDDEPISAGSWPVGLPKPMFIKWKELQEELKAQVCGATYALSSA